MIHEDGIQLRETLAANLRRLRIARHLSMSELARGTGMSKATLSGIENARANPTVETLGALARALRVSIGELLEEEQFGEIRIVRASRATASAQDGPGRRGLDALLPGGQALDLAELSLPPRCVHEVRSLASGTRAHVYVLQGKLVAGPVERCTELSVGDYAAFPADGPHIYETGRDRARVLLLQQRG